MDSRVIVLVGGWGIDPVYALSCLKERFPQDICHYVCPTRDFENKIPKDVDFLMGYSLGGLLVNASSASSDVPQVKLLAPALSIIEEHKYGGKISRRRLKAMIHSLGKEPFAPLRSFLKFIGFQGEVHALPYALEDLHWGLEKLLNTSPVLEAGRPHSIIVGGGDPLMDGNVLKEIFPENITVLPESGHGLMELLEEA